jgi:hypothetical protein
LGSFQIGFHLAGISFSSYKDKNRISGLLIIPASSFEKYISILLINSVLFFVLFSILYSLGTFIFCILSRTANGFFNTFSDGSLFFTGLFFSIQSMFFAGSLFFKKYESIKSVLIILLITIIFYFINYVLLISFYKISGYPVFSHMWTPLYVKIYFIVYSVLYFIILPILCLIAGYYRLKETELK